MAANILRSARARQMSIFVIRAFVRMREELAANAAILKRLADGVRQHGDGVVKRSETARGQIAGETRRAPYGRRVEQIDRVLLVHDSALRDVYRRLWPLLAPPRPVPRREIGFHTRLPPNLKPGRPRR